MSKAASKDTLADLHGAVAEVMAQMLRDYREHNERVTALYNAQITEAGGNVQAIIAITPPILQSPSAAELNAITKFLKDNEVTAAPGEGDLGKLADELAEHRKRRAIPPSPLEVAPFSLDDLPITEH